MQVVENKIILQFPPLTKGRWLPALRRGDGGVKLSLSVKQTPWPLLLSIG